MFFVDIGESVEESNLNESRREREERNTLRKARDTDHQHEHDDPKTEESKDVHEAEDRNKLGEAREIDTLHSHCEVQMEESKSAPEAKDDDLCSDDVESGGSTAVLQSQRDSSNTNNGTV